MDDYVFICYSRSDEHFVLPLANKLKDLGAPVWLDQWDIPPGANWIETIEDALSRCSRLLIILSPASIKSDDVQSEWLKGLREKKVLIPILYRTCKIPYKLAPYQYIDFTSANINDSVTLNLVLKALGMANGPLPKSAKITSTKKEIPVSDTYVANEYWIRGGSEFSNLQTLVDKVEVTTSSKSEVYIQDHKYSSIQEAVDAGNPFDTIILTSGIFQENLRIEKPFTIRGEGKDRTIIDGCRLGSVIVVGKNRSNIDVTLSGMTIKGGTGTSVSVDDNDAKTYVCGGGIINYGRLTLTDCCISNNIALYGGGIFNKGTLNLNRGASVIHNSAYNGGGIYGNKELISIDDGAVSSNKAEQLGGGIYIGYRCSIKIHSGTISDNNSGNNGGGVYSQGGLVYLCGGAIFNNNAHSSGGGIFCYGGRNNRLKGGFIHSNTARNGAGAVNGGGTMTLDGTRIHSNNADRNENGLGGGIMNSGRLILKNGSIDHNHAFKEGGGIFNSKNGEATGNLALVSNNTLGSERIPDEIAPLKPST